MVLTTYPAGAKQRLGRCSHLPVSRAPLDTMLEFLDKTLSEVDPDGEGIDYSSWAEKMKAAGKREEVALHSLAGLVIHSSCEITLSI